MQRHTHRNIAAEALTDPLFAQPGDSTDEQWMLAYIDVFIIIVTMFVVMFAITRSDHLSSQQEVVVGISALEESESDPQTGTDNTTPSYRSTDIAAPAPDLDEVIAALELTEQIRLEVTGEFIEVVLDDSILFGTADATLKPGAHDTLQSLLPLLDHSVGLIYIEGHTDNRPINNSRFPSNWELGSSRAHAVLHYLASLGMEQGRLRAVSYADTQPIAKNDSAEGRSRNRRVSLLIRTPDGYSAAAIDHPGIGAAPSPAVPEHRL